MRNQKETLRMDAPRFSRSHMPVRGILIALVTGLVFYTTFAFVNYTAGGPRVRGSVYISLTNPLTASLMLVFAIIMLALGIRKMRGDQRPWYAQQPILLGIGFLAATFGTLIIGEGLGNGLLSPLVGWSLAGLFLVTSVACIFIGNIRNPEHPERIGEATPQPKEAHEE